MKNIQYELRLTDLELNEITDKVYSNLNKILEKLFARKVISTISGVLPTYDGSTETIHTVRKSSFIFGNYKGHARTVQ